jgi:dienelactone hydrolase
MARLTIRGLVGRGAWLALGLAVLVAVPARGALVNPGAEAQNLLVSQERQAEFDSPGTVLGVAAATAAYDEQRAMVPVKDPGRDPNPNFCTLGACAIDPDLSHFTAHGGIADPVLFTNRAGATLSGHVWSTVAGPAKRPAIVIINGSIVGYEQGYWYLAQALAQDGYVVLTFDTQGEGTSDQFGQTPDQTEEAFAGTPGIGPQLGGNGLAFYDGGEDALNFLLSTPTRPYLPVPSRGTGTSHAAKQRQRVAAGLDSAYDPLWNLIDRNEIGITGHSYGAEAASWLGQSDPRIKAVVALDNLCEPVSPSPTELRAILGAPGNQRGLFELPPECFGAPPGPAPPVTKPALGISSDYLLTPEPYVQAPDPQAKEEASLAASKAGVDSGEIMIRGGTHFEFGDLPTGLIPATLRGIDMVTWYTTAWFDEYLKHEPSADARLLSGRWRDDGAGGAVDPSHDPNLLSYHYLSRLDIHLSHGQVFDCENLRAGCAGQTTASTDCGPASYSFLAVDTAQVATDTCGAGYDTDPGCPRATGRLTGRTLGLVRLGMTRAQAQRAYMRSSTGGTKYEEFFCLNPIGVRVGYTSPRLRAKLPSKLRNTLKGRVVWASTANPYYAVRGVRPGTTIAAAAKHLRLSPRFQVGLNDWYLAPNGDSTAVLKTRNGIVQEIGIAENQITRSHKATIAFLQSFA